ncbi:MAG: 16S rRNA (guanine(966)-N(2))-methyltransferase RsmD [Deltaproteobacteria bacterium GWC2_42_11]|nr:MAG: 16S rRNA (guanine(966)-N(2))-methyltransferase RsmD [Deltaproteobacteria bacterium GWC2_42_11]HBO84401.1 16S rRNA (guanine(966)-N(2))-methyltransferase RsmD [Deltaproteobacteria bacterium]
MRIIAGIAKGKRLFAPQGLSIRPTSDKVREAIFNILGKEFCYKAVLDLFAGTGAMGIETLSRGAEHAVFVDNNASALRIIKKNLDTCGLTERYNIIKMDVIKALQPSAFRLGKGFNLIFIDPPYRREDAGTILELIEKNKLLADDGIIVLETSKRTGVDESLLRLKEFDVRRYGDTVVRFYKNFKERIQ